MVLVIQVLAAVLLALGSGLIFRALLELDRTPPRRALRPTESPDEAQSPLRRAA